MNWENVLKVRRPKIGSGDKLFRLAFERVVKKHGGLRVSRRQFHDLMKSAIIELAEESKSKKDADYRVRMRNASALGNKDALFVYLKRVIGLPRANFIKNYDDNTTEIKLPKEWKQGD